MPDRPVPSNATRMLLILGGGFTTAMAAYHFFLPTMFGWAAEVKSVHPTVSWALFSLNFFFSFVLLALGVLTLLGVLLRRTHEWTYLAVAVAAAGFWLVNGSYQVIVPMPMPQRLPWAYARPSHRRAASDFFASLNSGLIATER